MYAYKIYHVSYTENYIRITIFEGPSKFITVLESDKYTKEIGHGFIDGEYACQINLENIKTHRIFVDTDYDHVYNKFINNEIKIVLQNVILKEDDYFNVNLYFGDNSPYYKFIRKYF